MAMRSANGCGPGNGAAQVSKRSKHSREIDCRAYCSAVYGPRRPKSTLNAAGTAALQQGVDVIGAEAEKVARGGVLQAACGDGEFESALVIGQHL